MNKKLLIFTLDNHEKLEILLNNKNDIIHCCYEASMALSINNENMIVSNSTITNYAERLHDKLALAINNKLRLDSSIIQGLGYYWNQWLNEDNPDLFYLQDQDSKYWIGINYFLWGTSGGAVNKFATWLYNDAQGNIIFEVTPLFPGTLVDWNDPVEMQAYQEWMKKKYKPFFTRIIPKDLAMQWLGQADTILTTIRENVKILKEKYENENNE